MADDRSEAEIVGGLLTVEVGGKPRPLRVLSMRDARVWKLALITATQGVATLDLSGADSIGPLVDAAGDRMLDLIVAYDQESTLGGREYLFEHATDVEIYGIFRRLLQVSFPFVRDLRTAITELRSLGLADLFARAQAAKVAESLPANTTSGAPLDGVLASTES